VLRFKTIRYLKTSRKITMYENAKGKEGVTYAPERGDIIAARKSEECLQRKEHHLKHRTVY
jgi:3'-phosphoadenosine 5'-phosphosulfate (PAPS) 3'-phosphatase